MDVMFGIDPTSLSNQSGPTIPDEVAGRYLQLDADFLVYHATYDDSLTFEQCVYNYTAEAEKLRVLAGAEFINHHLTASGSAKGGRYEQAIQKPYQDNRSGKEKPKFLEVLRKHIRDELGGLYWEDIEADDGMCIKQQQYLDKDERQLSIIWSGDKDLTMMEGLHLCNDTYDIVDVHGYGSCNLVEKSGTKKVKGWGTSFFWHQMLMGDTADNIQGVANLPAEILDEYFPTKAMIEADPEKLAKLLGTRKPQPCGAAKAYAILEGCTTDREAANLVVKVYRACYGDDWLRIFDSESKLLWMRRRYENKENDFKLWLKQEVL